MCGEVLLARITYEVFSCPTARTFSTLGALPYRQQNGISILSSGARRTLVDIPASSFDVRRGLATSKSFGTSVSSSESLYPSLPAPLPAHVGGRE